MISKPEGRVCHRREVCTKRWKIGKKRCRKKALRWVGYKFTDLQDAFSKGRFVLRRLKLDIPSGY